MDSRSAVYCYGQALVPAEDERPSKSKRKSSTSTKSASKASKSRGGDDADGGPKKKVKRVKKERELGPDGEPLKRSSGPKHTFLPALASLTGVQADHRPQALKLVWKYIKEHELQDPRNKTEILCDDKMAAITGGERSCVRLDTTLMHINLSIYALPVVITSLNRIKHTSLMKHIGSQLGEIYLLYTQYTPVLCLRHTVLLQLSGDVCFTSYISKHCSDAHMYTHETVKILNFLQVSALGARRAGSCELLAGFYFIVELHAQRA
eukprot:15990-Heterococcus_DN1.PRE.1